MLGTTAGLRETLVERYPGMEPKGARNDEMEAQRVRAPKDRKTFLQQALRPEP
jgi:hypothetical protein